MKSFKTLALVVALSTSTSHAHAGPLFKGQLVPGLLATVSGLAAPLGGIVNPLLKPVGAITGALVGDTVNNATPHVVNLLNIVLNRPEGGLLGGKSVGASNAAFVSPGLPPLAGLE